MIPAAQAEVAAFLAGLAGADPVETHISAVFLGTDTVWKLKKAVRLPFLDFTRATERRRFLLRELALNQRWAPGLYRDVAAVARREGGLVLDPAAEDGVDWVLRMARAPTGAFLDRMAAEGRLTPAVLLAVADMVAEMHLALPPAVVPDPAGRMRIVADGNGQAALASGLPAAAVVQWLDGVLAAIGARAELLRGRAASGLVRRAHGDLHLGNLLMWEGRPAPFDALEFDEGLATIDLGYDLAFLLMDLERLVSRAAANLVLGRYVGRTGDAGLVGALPPFLALRAMVRAHVAASRGEDGSGYLDAALGYLRPGAPVVVAVGGLMGTGKTTLARALAPQLGPAPGALVVRSDEARKRLHGMRPEERLPPEAYAAEGNRRTDAALLDGVRSAVKGGHAVVADATFLDPALRAAIAEAARAAGVPFLGVWLQAPLDILERRILARRDDASDASVAVLRAVGTRALPEGWRVVDARDADVALAEVQNALRDV